MILKALTDLDIPKIKKWAVHRSDGLLFRESLGDDKGEAIHRFIAKKHPTVPSVKHFEVFINYWNKVHGYTCNEVFITYEEFISLVNEKQDGKTVQTLQPSRSHK